jgi:hypothetical protein
MKRISLHSAFICLIICFVSNLLAENTPTDFRSATWGMSPSQLKSTESGKPSFETRQGSRMMIWYTDSIAGLDSNVVYIFAYEKLARAKYVIKVDHTNKNDYLSDFRMLWKSLSEKYGKPTTEHTFWKNDLYKNNPNDWGMAVAVGHLVKFSDWETPTTLIILRLTGDNFKIQLGIEYSSKELRSLEQKALKEEQIQKF